MFGLARVNWTLNGDQLTRSVEDVTAAPVDEEGNEQPKPVEARTDKVASNVDSFEIRMGYWFEGQWLLAEDWDSRLNTYRNPVEEDESLTVDPTQVSAQGMGESIQTELNQRGLQFIPDNLPAWVEVTMSFRDPRDAAKVTRYRNVVQLPMAQETYFDQELTQGAAAGNRPGTRRRLTP
jgi:hypothetical protein